MSLGSSFHTELSRPEAKLDPTPGPATGLTNLSDFRSSEAFAKRTDDAEKTSFGNFKLPGLDFDSFNINDRAKETDKADLTKYEDKAFDAYMDALGKAGSKGYGEKFTVVMFTRENCGFCERNKGALGDEGGKFNKDAVFSVADPTKDSGAKQLFEAVDGKAYPMTVVFATSRDRIHVVGQAVGELDKTQMQKFLNDSMKKPMSAYNKDETLFPEDTLTS